MKRQFLLMKYICFFTCFSIIAFAAVSCKQNNDLQEAITFTPDPQPVEEQEVTILAIGQQAPDFRLPGVDGKYHELSDFRSAEVLVIVFTCNHCPTAQAYEDRLIKIADDYKAKNVQVIAISPNATAGLLLEELGYSDMGDSFEEMIVRAEEKNYNFPYLYDGDNHRYSLVYGPVATPHAYVFDNERRLQYVGRIDKSEKPGTAHGEDLRAAIDAVLDGRTPEVAQTKVFGCSIKWAWKNQYAIKVNKEWTEKEVTLENIDMAGIESLLKNETSKLRLINIWATWCGPCIMEYPDFVDIHRMYMGRDFEFVSISLDNMESKDKALQFLQEQSSALSNFIYDGLDKYEFIEAIDPDWDGALPYTLLLEPGGKIVYSVMGTMAPYEVKKAIVDHPLIGRYY